MRSIRRQLTVWLLGGLGLLWLSAGAGVYLAVRSSLLKAVDAELAVDARLVRFLVRGGESEEAAGGEPDGRGAGSGRLSERVPAYQEAGGGSFYEAWTAGGDVVERSLSLGSWDLPFPKGAGSDPEFGFARLEDGRELRTMTFAVAGGGKGRGKGKNAAGERASGSIVALAKDLQSVESTLASLLGGLGAIGVLVAGGAVALVGVALGRGLKPLRELSARTETIDVNSLDARFDSAGAPAELLPVYERLNDLMNRIEGSFERERRFSSDLAHEMRTPVAQLKMISEIALKWPDQGGIESHREGLELVGQLESMITNLLALARWESGEAPLKRETVSLGTVVEECWKSRSELAGEKNLRVQFNLQEAPVWETDPDMLRHIIDNLLCNAVEYTPEGKQIAVFGQPDGLEIANSALDVRAEDLEHFFERYWRRDPARGDQRHAGLGLTLAKACAEILGLTLSVRLEGEAVRFFLKKPRPSS